MREMNPPAARAAGGRRGEAEWTGDGQGTHRRRTSDGWMADGWLMAGRWAADERHSRIHLHQGGAMGMTISVTRTNHGKLVRVFTHLGKVIRDQQSALTSRTKGPPVGREVTNASPTRVDVSLVSRKLLSRILLQFRLVIKGVHLARRPIHHEEDAILRLGLEMRRLGV